MEAAVWKAGTGGPFNGGPGRRGGGGGDAVSEETVSRRTHAAGRSFKNGDGRASPSPSNSFVACVTTNDSRARVIATWNSLLSSSSRFASSRGANAQAALASQPSAASLARADAGSTPSFALTSRTWGHSRPFARWIVVSDTSSLSSSPSPASKAQVSRNSRSKAGPSFPSTRPPSVMRVSAIVLVNLSRRRARLASFGLFSVDALVARFLGRRDDKRI